MTNIIVHELLSNSFFKEIDCLIDSASYKTTEMLRIAVRLMANTKDPAHDPEHIKRLLINTNRFLKSQSKRFDIDKEVILLSIYWHDVWKAKRKPTVVNYFFHQMYEGVGSMFMFQQYAKSVGISPRIVSKVSYATRKHSFFQVIPPKTLEAKLLRDVDALDRWYPERTKVVFRNFGKINLFIFDSYIVFLKKVAFPLYFDWTKREVEKTKPLFFNEMSSFRKTLYASINGVKA